MRRAGLALLLVGTASLAAAQGTRRPRPAAAAPPKPTVTVLGLSIVGPALGDEDDQVRPFNDRPGTELTLALAVPAPAGIIEVTGDDERPELEAGAPLEDTEYGWHADYAPDRRLASITVRSNAVPERGAASLSATGTLKVMVSPGAVTEKIPGVKLQPDATFRLGGALITVAAAQSDEETLKPALRGPAAVLKAVRAIRLRTGAGAVVEGDSRGSQSGDEVAEYTYSFKTKSTSGSLEVELWQSPRELAVPFRVTASLGLPAPPAEAALVSRSRATPLPLGTAVGELIVDGTPIRLAHAAAVSGPDEFDDTKEAFTVFLTEKPIPPGVLEKAASLKAADQELPGIAMTVRQEGKNQSYRLLLRHAAAGKGLMQTSMLSDRDRWMPLGPDRVDGVVKSFFDEGPTEMVGHQVRYRIRFNAPLRKRFPVEPPLALGERTTSLGSGGGEPGQAYLKSECGPLPFDVNDPKAVEAYLEKEGKLPTDKDLADMSRDTGKPVTREEAIKLVSGLLALASALRPSDCKVLGGSHDGRLAILQVEATVMGERSVADAYLLSDGSTWKFKKHGTWKAARR